MNSLFKLIRVAAVIVLACSVGVSAGRNREIVKTFDAKDVVRINTVSGDCTVWQGQTDKIEVRMVYDVDPEDIYEPEFRERSNSLRLNENIHGSCSGSSEWVITVPEGTRIKFSSASGEFRAEDLIGEFDVSTASGDIELINCQGDFELSSASGSVLTEKCSGFFDLSSASGPVEAMDVKIEHASEFSSASGDVEVVLGSGPVQDLTVSTASGRAVLDYNGHSLTGHFEFVCKARKGRMDSPVEFETEETFRRHGDDYIARTFTKGADTPEILLETASGRVALRN
jgi:hypothetical protein